MNRSRAIGLGVVGLTILGSLWWRSIASQDEHKDTPSQSPQLPPLQLEAPAIDDVETTLVAHVVNGFGVQVQSDVVQVTEEIIGLSSVQLAKHKLQERLPEQSSSRLVVHRKQQPLSMTHSYDNDTEHHNTSTQEEITMSKKLKHSKLFHNEEKREETETDEHHQNQSLRDMDAGNESSPIDIAPSLTGNELDDVTVRERLDVETPIQYQPQVPQAVTGSFVVVKESVPVHDQEHPYEMMESSRQMHAKQEIAYQVDSWTQDSDDMYSTQRKQRDLQEKNMELHGDSEIIPQGAENPTKATPSRDMKESLSGFVHVNDESNANEFLPKKNTKISSKENSNYELQGIPSELGDTPDEMETKETNYMEDAEINEDNGYENITHSQIRSKKDDDEDISQYTDIIDVHGKETIVTGLHENSDVAKDDGDDSKDTRHSQVSIHDTEYGDHRDESIFFEEADAKAGTVSLLNSQSASTFTQKNDFNDRSETHSSYSQVLHGTDERIASVTPESDEKAVSDSQNDYSLSVPHIEHRQETKVECVEDDPCQHVDHPSYEMSSESLDEIDDEPLSISSELNEDSFNQAKKRNISLLQTEVYPDFQVSSLKSLSGDSVGEPTDCVSTDTQLEASPLASGTEMPIETPVLDQEHKQKPKGSLTIIDDIKIQDDHDSATESVKDHIKDGNECDSQFDLEEKLRKPNKMTVDTVAASNEDFDKDIVVAENKESEQLYSDHEESGGEMQLYGDTVPRQFEASDAVFSRDNTEQSRKKNQSGDLQSRSRIKLEPLGAMLQLASQSDCASDSEYVEVNHEQQIETFPVVVSPSARLQEDIGQDTKRNQVPVEERQKSLQKEFSMIGSFEEVVSELDDMQTLQDHAIQEMSKEDFLASGSQSNISSIESESTKKIAPEMNRSCDAEHDDFQLNLTSNRLLNESKEEAAFEYVSYSEIRLQSPDEIENDSIEDAKSSTDMVKMNEAMSSSQKSHDKNATPVQTMDSHARKDSTFPQGQHAVLDESHFVKVTKLYDDQDGDLLTIDRHVDDTKKNGFQQHDTVIPEYPEVDDTSMAMLSSTNAGPEVVVPVMELDDTKRNDPIVIPDYVDQSMPNLPEPDHELSSEDFNDDTSTISDSKNAGPEVVVPVMELDDTKRNDPIVIPDYVDQSMPNPPELQTVIGTAEMFSVPELKEAIDETTTKEDCEESKSDSVDTLRNSIQRSQSERHVRFDSSTHNSENTKSIATDAVAREDPYDQKVFKLSRPKSGPMVGHARRVSFKEVTGNIVKKLREEGFETLRLSTRSKQITLSGKITTSDASQLNIILDEFAGKVKVSRLALTFVRDAEKVYIPADEASSLEYYDGNDSLLKKVKHLAKLIRESHHFVVYSGESISVNSNEMSLSESGRPTLMRRVSSGGRISLEQPDPTFTHKALACLMDHGYLKYITCESTDGLHRKSGVPAEKISELYGNPFRETCCNCNAEFLRHFDVSHLKGRYFQDIDDPYTTSGISHITGRKCDFCDGMLRDNAIFEGKETPDGGLDRAIENSQQSDLALCIGSSLSEDPICNLPQKCLDNQGKMVIVHRQATSKDKEALKFGGIILNHNSDLIMDLLLKELGLELFREPDPLEQQYEDDFVKVIETVDEKTEELEDIDEFVLPEVIYIGNQTLTVQGQASDWNFVISRSDVHIESCSAFVQKVELTLENENVVIEVNDKLIGFGPFSCSSSPTLTAKIFFHPRFELPHLETRHLLNFDQTLCFTEIVIPESQYFTSPLSPNPDTSRNEHEQFELEEI